MIRLAMCVIVILPFFGVAMAIYTKSAAWLALLILCAAW